MPGKHYKGMPKYKKKGMPKLSEKQAKHIDTNKDGKISGADFPINKGIGNYKGSGNFAMKNKVLMKSAKYGEPMQKNFLGKAMMGPLTNDPTKNPKKKVKITKNKDGSFTKSSGDTSQTYKPNPNYKPGSARTTNYKYVTGEKDASGAPIGTNTVG